MRNKLLILLLTFVVISTGYSQTKRAYIKAAEKAMLEENYYAALTYFNEALEFDKDSPELLYKTGKAAKKFKAFEMASERYGMLLDTLQSDVYPRAWLEYGQVLTYLGEYDHAEAKLDTFINGEWVKEPEDETLATNLKSEIQWAKEAAKNPDNSAELEQINAINTPESDFGATMLDDYIFYSTMSHVEDDDERKIERNISKIHKWDGSMQEMVEGEINDGNTLVGNTTFSKDGSWIFYTECNYNIFDEVICKIVKRPVNEDGTFGAKEELPASINAANSTSTHPHIGYDAENERAVLYFVSNREGGQGGMDIYYAVFNSSGQLSEPINMDEINTSGDDITPFYHAESNALFFSSNGYKSLGGFDIYSISLEDLTAEPTNILAPVNSSYDDLYYIVDADKVEGYFSSNRATAARLDNVTKACCFDIFKVTYKDVVIELNALTFDSLTRRELPGATVYLIEKETGDTIDVVTNDDGNDHEFLLERNKDYELLATREFYDDYRHEISTHDISDSTKLIEELYMSTDMMQLDLFTFNNKTKEPLAGTRVIVRNLTDRTWEVLDLTNPIGNDYHIYLDTGDKYDIEVSKFGFVTKHEEVDLSEVTEPGLITRNVYLDVFEIEEYADTNVYFENDYPNPKTISTDTDVRYGEHYEYYIHQKPVYIEKAQKSKRILNKLSAVEEIDAFFEGEVAGGYAMFKKFMRALKKELELGRKLEVQLKGYASPVAESAYNMSLSQRRVQSVLNEMLDFEDGVFRDYLGNKQLIITDLSFGDEKAPADVSDNPRNILESVYSVKAARERRVEIIRIKDQ